jgi:electron transport complex protein RnfC
LTAAKMYNSNIGNSVELAKTEEHHLDMKKRRITAAVAKAKAKAKRSAEKADNNKQDKPL